MITNWNKGNGEDGGEGDAKNNNGATHIDTKKEYPKNKTGRGQPGSK